MLTIIRHGQSEANLQKFLGGWLDVNLTPLGIEQAHLTGKLLKEQNLHFDLCCNSFLKRAKITRDIILKEIDSQDIPIYETWRLNEVHSGDFSGHALNEYFKYDPSLIDKWFTTYDIRPPLFEEGGPNDPKLDPLYNGVEGHDQLPLGESFHDACLRLQPFWNSTIIPNLQDGKSILCVSHGNIVRIIMKIVENLSPTQCMQRMVIPNCTAVIYYYNNGNFDNRKIIGSPEALRKYSLEFETFNLSQNL